MLKTSKNSKAKQKNKNKTKQKTKQKQKINKKCMLFHVRFLRINIYTVKNSDRLWNTKSDSPILINCQSRRPKQQQNQNDNNLISLFTLYNTKQVD